MSKDKIPEMFGCIDNSEFAFRARVVDEECETLEQAMEAALEMLKNGTEEVAVCRCRYEGDWEDGNGTWVEDIRYGAITVNAYNAGWVVEEEEEEEECNG